MYDPIQNVKNRIQEIESRFSANKAYQVYQKKNDQVARQEGQPSAAVQSAAVKQGGANQFETLIAEAANKYGVDPKLVNAVAKTESNYRSDAVSEAGAVGVMQLMPQTATSLGVKNPYDPRDNIDGGTKYLKELMNTFNGDITKTVAAYNAGPQAVKNYNGVPPYTETQNYVKKVLDLYR